MHSKHLAYPSTRTHRPGRYSISGFTLVELVTVLAIVALLAVLTVSGARVALRKTAQSQSLHLLRQIGSGIQLYATDHDNTLPGPLFTSIQPRIRQSDTHQLATRIAPYLGYEVNNTWQPMKEMLFPTWKKQINGYNPAAGGLSTLMCNWNDYDRDVLSSRPFGYPGSDPWSSGPVKLTRIPDPDRLWLVCEQAQPGSNPPEFLTAPNQRMFLFTNGRVSLESSTYVSYP